MTDENRSDVDRRFGTDRRREFYSRKDNFRYFANGAAERRNWEERRSTNERREDWFRVNEWCSCWWET